MEDGREMITGKMRLRPECCPKVVSLTGDVDDLTADGQRRLQSRIVADAVAEIVLQFAHVLRRRRRRCQLVVARLLHQPK